MIEKLDKDCGKLQKKINELVDAVNAIQKEREAERFEIQEWIGILEAVRKSVNIHEKQIDELQMKLEPEKCETPSNRMIGSVTFDKIEGKMNPEPVDKFTEQKKWIGKLCRFWDDEKDSCFSILVDMCKYAPYPYCASGDWWYKHCEPVKPDDLIIYQGE